METDPTRELNAVCVRPTDTIRASIACIDHRGRAGIALVVDDSGQLVGTVTDGDVRRAMLAGLSLEMPVSVILEKKRGSIWETPITAPEESTPQQLLAIMQERSILQMPLVDSAGRLRRLVTYRDLLPDAELPVTAVVMAGGEGLRLRPLTRDVPKPMLPVADRPILEHIMERLRRSGVRQVSVTTHYLADAITGHFGNGSEFGLDIQYTSEDRPLGTAGALRLLGSKGAAPLLVLNGDVLTGIDFDVFLSYHRETRATLTMAVRPYEVRVPYGVVEGEGGFVRRVSEKPELRFFVNAGVYLVEPRAMDRIPEGKRFDMTDLIERLLADGEPVASFALREYWIDIGGHEDYQRARSDMEQGRV